MEKPRGKTPLHIIETLANLCDDDDDTLHEKKTTTTTTCFNTSVDTYTVYQIIVLSSGGEYVVVYVAKGGFRIIGRRGR